MTSSTVTRTPALLVEAFDRSEERCLDGRILLLGEYPAACGGHADVWRGELAHRAKEPEEPAHPANGELAPRAVAAKVVRQWSSVGNKVEQAKLLKRLWREYLAWSCLSHPNVLELLGFTYDVCHPDFLFPALISPWMSNGSVDSYIATREITDRLNLLLGIAEGLSYLHTREPAIVHGDLRAGNVLVSDSGVPCLSDFGLSRVLSETKQTPTSSEPAGSLRWMSPELFRDEGGVSVHSDVWAFGMTVLEVLTGNRPYSSVKNDAYLLGQITLGNIPQRPEDPVVCDLFNDELWLMCQKCWSSQPAERPAVQDLIYVLRGYSGSSDSQIPPPDFNVVQSAIVTSFAVLPVESPFDDSTQDISVDTNATQVVVHSRHAPHTPPPGPVRDPVSEDLDELAALEEISQLHNAVRELRQCRIFIEHVKVFQNECNEIHIRCVQQLLDLQPLVANKYSQLAVEGVESTIHKFLNMVGTWSTWSNSKSILHEHEIGQELKQITESLSRQPAYLNVFARMAKSNAIDWALVDDRDSEIDDDSPRSHTMLDYQPGQYTFVYPDMTPYEYAQSVAEDAQRCGVCIISGVRRLTKRPVSADELRDEYLGEWPTHRDGRVSLKLIRGAKDMIFQNRFMQVLEKLQDRQHHNVERLYGLTIVEDQLYTLSPWAVNRDVLTYIKNNPHVNKLNLLVDVAMGLEFLHRNDIVHGDLRAAQILIAEDGVAYISDFGMRELVEEFDGVSPPPPPGAETIRWMAPELIDPTIRRFPIYRTSMSDVWSFGMLCLEIYTGERPFHEQRHIEVVRSGILSGIRPATAGHLSHELRALMYKCWQQDQGSRPSSSKVALTLSSIRKRYGPVQLQNYFTPLLASGGGSLSRGPAESSSSQALRLHLSSGRRTTVGSSITESPSHSPTSPSLSSELLNPTQNLELDDPLSLVEAAMGSSLPESESDDSTPELCLNPFLTATLTGAAVRRDYAYGSLSFNGIDNQFEHIRPVDSSKDLLSFDIDEFVENDTSPKTFDVFPKDDGGCINGSVSGIRDHRPGSYTDIWTGTFGTFEVAIKTIRPFLGAGTQNRERRILERLWLQYTRASTARHPNILRCHGFSYDFSPKPSVFPALIFTWMSKGTLSSYLTKYPDVDIYDLALGVARGLSYLHAQVPPIIHGDVRAENILVSGSGVPCLSEVHITDILKVEGVHTSAHTISSLRWTSPELLLNDTGPTIHSDVWAYGMTLLEMVSGNIPYQEVTSPAAVFGRIREGNIPLRPASVSNEIWAICLKCWNVNWRQRPSMRTVLDEIETRRTSISESLSTWNISQRPSETPYGLKQ